MLSARRKSDGQAVTAYSESKANAPFYCLVCGDEVALKTGRNENAENDELLYHCAVPTPTTGGTGVKHILTGRWGTGKSARLLLANKELNEALKKIDPALDRAWYVDEQSLDAGALFQAREASVGDPQTFRKSLERLWTIEILRKAVLLLESLRPIYSNTTGDHWAFVHTMNNVGGIAESVWKQLTSVLKLFGLPQLRLGQFERPE